MFDEVASQPVPDRFLLLLDELEKSSSDDRAPGGNDTALATKAKVGSPK